MQLEWIYYPITQYTVTGVGLIACLTLWAGAKAEIRRVRTALTRSLAQIESGVTALTAAVEDVKNSRSAAEPPPAPAPVPAPFLQGLNLTKRTQILRMKRRGEGPHSIAAALRIPVGEVTLILKMESLQSVPDEGEAKVVPLIAKSAGRGIL